MSSQPDPDDRFVVHDPSGQGDRWVICDTWGRATFAGRPYTDVVAGEIGSPAYTALAARCQELNDAHNARLREQARQIREEGTLPLGLALTLYDAGLPGKPEEEKG